MTMMYYWAMSEKNKPTRFCIKSARDGYLAGDSNRRKMTSAEIGGYISRVHAEMRRSYKNGGRE